MCFTQTSTEWGHWGSSDKAIGARSRHCLDFICQDAQTSIDKDLNPIKDISLQVAPLGCIVGDWLVSPSGTEMCRLHCTEYCVQSSNGAIQVSFWAFNRRLPCTAYCASCARPTEATSSEPTARQ